MSASSIPTEPFCNVHMLIGQHSQLCIRQTDTFELIHWGERMPHISLQEWAEMDQIVPNGRLDKSIPLSLCPTQGEGNFGNPSLEGHRNGTAWSPVFKAVSADLLPDNNGLKLVLSDPIAELNIQIELFLDIDCDVLKIRSTLTNTGSSTYTVQRFSQMLPLPHYAEEILSFHGRWIREFHTDRHIQRHGAFLQENRRGRTSHEYFPGLIQGRTGFSEQKGEVYGFHLGWSGNHRMRSDIKIDGRRYLQAEALFEPGEITIEQGESFQTPWLYGSFSAQGTNRMSQQFHQFIRHNLLHFPSNKSRPIHLNTWEGIYFNHDPEYIMRMIERSAEIGVERFILDDGWFLGRRSDKAGLGDWIVDPEIYPEGLYSIISYAESLGMEFGLWFEPEMVNPDSDLFRTHPDWILAEPGYVQPLGRNQYVLDLQREDVFNYLFDRLDQMLTSYAIRYIKWDMNREVVQPGHQSRAGMHGQTLAVYRLIDSLKQRHPTVEFEACASGGGRIDYGILERSHRFWVSDNNDALERQLIQRGFSYFFPLEIMGSHIGHHTSHNTRRRHTLDMRAISALFGHLGVELDPVKSNELELNGYRHFINLHKEFRPLLHTGDYYRLETPDPAQHADMVLAKDGEKALVRLFQREMLDYAMPGNLKIPDLLPHAKYRIHLLHRPDCLDCHIMSRAPAWCREDIESSGEWLNKFGITLPVLDPESALLIEITRQDNERLN